jgi:1,6-anhydro-N-acetylmuramate kinase
MWPRKLLPLLATLLLLAGCQTGKQDATTLERLQVAPDSRVAVQIPVTCTDVSEVCARDYAEHAAACLNLVEAADPSTREKMRTCAQQDFRQSLAHSPAGTDRLVATRGLAEATRIARDNSADYAANARELDGLSGQLGAMPGGTAYAAYYAADNDLSRVLTRNVPPAQACATLKGAEAKLPAASAANDLGQNLTTLRNNLTTAMKNRGCV